MCGIYLSAIEVGIKSKEVAKRLHSNDGAGDGIVFRNRILKKNLQGFPGAATEIGQQLPIVEEVTAKDLRDADTLKGTRDEMPVRDLFEDIHAEPLTEFHHPLLVP